MHTSAQHHSALHLPSQLQLNRAGSLQHFLGIEGLSRAHLTRILDTAETFLGENGRILNQPLLDGRTVMNLFFEPSTRTRTTFEVAAKHLSANVLNIDIQRSSTSKGETLRDTLWNLEAMTADVRGASFGFRRGAFYGAIGLSSCGDYQCGRWSSRASNASDVGYADDSSSRRSSI
jgi:hypothetical protein